MSEAMQSTKDERGEAKRFDDGENGKTYNTGDSLVVTHRSTSPAICGLITGERTGPDVFHSLWSYVRDHCLFTVYKAQKKNSSSTFPRSLPALQPQSEHQQQQTAPSSKTPKTRQFHSMIICAHSHPSPFSLTCLHT
ncbi:hypothetical protein BDY21DRAFT_219127 [Lineolata rhizophorae]|uniref:Uncharacterized protein n=1 Tax=Lineolata rhizophorae TaxID=578093 RepID=A0A6A6P2Z3_9PEZI|nr:hypothetical protein BDY21DRAFT_219127 [Lineolata rhizophorae]